MTDAQMIERKLDSEAPTLAELKEMFLDPKSEFNSQTPVGKRLRARYSELKAVENAKPKVLEYPKEVKPVAPNMVRLEEFHNATWRIDVENVPPAHFEDPTFLANVPMKMTTYDHVVVIDTLRRTWSSAIVSFAEPNTTPRLKVLSTVQLDPLDNVRGSDNVPGHEVRFDPNTGTYSAFRLKDGVCIVREIPNKAVCFAELREHASLRKPGTDTNYLP